MKLNLFAAALLALLSGVASAHSSSNAAAPQFVQGDPTQQCWVDGGWIPCKIALNGLDAQDLMKADGVQALPTARESASVANSKGDPTQQCWVDGELTICKIALNGLPATDVNTAALHRAVQAD